MPLKISQLQTLAIFAGCAAVDLKGVAAAVTAERNVDEGGVLCREGDTPDKWWIVVEGTGDVTVDGRYLSSVGPGESIGELALLDGKPRSATVTATSDMLVWEVDGEGFIGALLESSRLALALLQELAQRLRRSNEPDRWRGPLRRHRPSQGLESSDGC